MTIFSKTKSTATKPLLQKHPDFGDITFINNPSSRSLRLSVEPFKGLQVKMPPRFSHKKALVFIESKREWIMSALKGMEETENLSIKFFSETPQPKPQEIRHSLSTRLSEIAQLHGFEYGKVSIRNQKSRWGSCSSANNISLNQKLYFLPPHLRDYVLLHELAHTEQKNHSPAFWSILHKVLGRVATQRMRRELRQYAFLFYPPPKTT